jgi:glucose-6-phosphate dehydrogenase assembly protein OpcA
VVRACTLNLMVLVPGGEQLARVSDVIARLSTGHPSRAIVMVAEPDVLEPGLEAWISAHCQVRPAGSSQVCCEQITIAARGQATHDLHGMAVPLLEPDLPVFLWWLGDPPLDDHLFDVLAGVSDRLIVDSAGFRAPEATLARLAGRFATPARPGRAALSDLNWARLTPWRQLIAQFFDSPNLQPFLEMLTDVDVSFDPGSGDRPNPAQALLLTVWLASRLDWKSPGAPFVFKEAPADRSQGEDYHQTLYGRQPVRVRLHLGASGSATAGSLTEVTLAANAAGQSARFVVSLGEHRDYAVTTVEVEGMKPVSRVVHMDDPEEARLVGADLDILGHNPVYEAALLAATGAP